MLAVGLDAAVTATLRHSALRVGKNPDYIAIYGHEGTLHVEGAYDVGAKRWTGAVQADLSALAAADNRDSTGSTVVRACLAQLGQSRVVFDLTRAADDELVVELTDGRVIAAPLLWFPRLSYGTVTERNTFVAARKSIHWPELDEDIGIETLLLGRGQGERPEAFQRWLEARGKVHA